MLLYGDAALERIEVDILGVREFAVKIAQSMLAQQMNAGLVYGLEGTWGSGKSTLKNHILCEVNSSYFGPRNQKPIIIQFDPWIQRGVQPLVGALLEEIKAGISQAGLESESIVAKAGSGFEYVGNKAAEHREAIVALGEFVGAIADVALPVPSPSSKSGKISRLLGTCAKMIRKRADDPAQSVHSLKSNKERVDKAIVKLQRQLIISIDDIDRLDPREIMEVMRLVRSVADFSNTIYLLNYDPSVVASAAKEVHGVDNSKRYLEKIVNIPIRVPVHEPYDLIDWFKKAIDGLLKDYQLFDSWSQRYEQGNDLEDAISDIGRYFLKTPRDVARALDSVRIALGSIKGEIWLPDLVWISIIRTGSHELHNWIERYLSEFSIVSDGSAEADDHDRYKFNRELAALSGELDIKETRLRDVLRSRLPGISTVTLDVMRHLSGDERIPNELSKGNEGVFGTISTDELNELRSNARLASPDHYRLYFSFLNRRTAIQMADIAELRSTLSRGRAPTIRFLERLDDQRISRLTSKFERMFEFLASTNLKDFDGKEIVELISAIADVLDDTSRFEEIEFSFSRRGWRSAANLLGVCLSHLDAKAGNELVEMTFRSGKAISWLSYVARRSQPSRRSGDNETWLSNEHFEIAKRAILKRHSQLKIADLKSTAMPTSNFFAWVAMAGDQTVRHFIEKNSKKDEEFLDCLELLMNVRREMTGIGFLVMKKSNFIDPKTLARFFDLTVVTTRLSTISGKKANLRVRADQLANLIAEGEKFSV